MKRMVEKLFRSIIVLMVVFASVSLNLTSVSASSSIPLNSVYATKVNARSTYWITYTAPSTTSILFEYVIPNGCTVTVSTGPSKTIIKPTKIVSNVFGLSVVKGSTYYFAIYNSTYAVKDIRVLLAERNVTSGKYTIKTDNRAVSWVSLSDTGKVTKAVYFWNPTIATQNYSELQAKITREAPALAKEKAFWLTWVTHATSTSNTLISVWTDMYTKTPGELKLPVDYKNLTSLVVNTNKTYIESELEKYATPTNPLTLDQSIYIEIVKNQLEVANNRDPVMLLVYANAGVRSGYLNKLTKGIIITLVPAVGVNDYTVWKAKNLSGDKDYFYRNFPGSGGKERIKIDGSWYEAMYTTWNTNDYSTITSSPFTKGYFSFY